MVVAEVAEVAEALANAAAMVVAIAMDTAEAIEMAMEAANAVEEDLAAEVVHTMIEARTEEVVAAQEAEVAANPALEFVPSIGVVLVSNPSRKTSIRNLRLLPLVRSRKLTRGSLSIRSLSPVTIFLVPCSNSTKPAFLNRSSTVSIRTTTSRPSFNPSRGLSLSADVT